MSLHMLMADSVTAAAGADRGPGLRTGNASNPGVWDVQPKTDVDHSKHLSESRKKFTVALDQEVGSWLGPVLLW